MKNYIITGLAVLIVVFGIGLLTRNPEQVQLSGFLTSTVTNTTSSVSNVSTLVSSSTANLQYLELANAGDGQVSCSFGAAAVANNGMRLNPVGSSTLTIRVITDQNLLAKGVFCIANATSALQVLKY